MTDTYGARDAGADRRIPDPIDRSGPEGGGRSLLLGLAILALVAFLVRLVPVLAGGGLQGAFAYDDEVYFAAAVAMVEGRIPYRDFVLLHPPGILYLLAPIAALGGVVGDGTAFAMARVSLMLVGALNAVLVVLVARTIGRLAAAAAGALYAVWMVPIVVERSTWLIGPQNTLILLALLILGGMPPRSLTVSRVALAGACIAAAGVIQLWTAIPAIVVLVWLVASVRAVPERLVRLVAAYVVSGVTTAVILFLPFLLVTGASMIRLIVFAQLVRIEQARVGLASRLAALVGLPAAGPFAHVLPGVIVAAGVLVVALLVLSVAWRERRMSLWVALLFTQGAFLLLTPVFFRHYAAWLAPTVSLSVGSVAAWIIGHLGGTQRRAGFALYGVGLAVLLVVALRPAATGIPVSSTRPDLSAARCVTADSPILLIRTETLRRDLERGCPLEVDPKGVSHTTRLDHPATRPGRRNDPAYQQAMLEYYGASDAALFSRLDQDGLAPSTMDRIRQQLPVESHVGLITIYRRSQP